jgi:hypothetical protein
MGQGPWGDAGGMSMPELARVETGFVAIHELESGLRAAASSAGADQGQAVMSRPMPRASSQADQPM